MGEFLDCIEGYRDRIEQQQLMQDQLNHLLGQYCMVAFNEPKKYPNRPILSETARDKNHMMTPEQHENLARARYG